MLSLSAKTLSRLRVTIWVLVGFQIAFALATLAASGLQATNIKDKIHMPGIPSKLGYEIFISVFTFVLLPAYPLLTYFKPTWWTNFRDRFGLLPFLISSAVFAIFWIAATGSAFYTCGDMCSVYSPLDAVALRYTNKLCCICEGGASESVTCPSGGGQIGNFNIDLGSDNDAGVAYWATQGFAVLNMLFFFASTTIWVLLFIASPRTAAEDDGEMVEQESHIPQTYSTSAPDDEAYHTYGSEPMAGAPDTGIVDHGRQSPYSHGQMPFESQYTGYGQTQMPDARPFIPQPEGPYDGRGYGPPPVDGQGYRY